MSSLNKIQLIGRVGKTPEITRFDSGVQVAKFSLATSEKFTNKQGEKVENTEWHNIVIWNKLTDVVKDYVQKGMLLYVEGKVKTRTYEKDGQKHYLTEVFADSIQMLSRADNKEQDSNLVNYEPELKQEITNSPAQTAPVWSNHERQPEEDLPF